MAVGNISNTPLEIGFVEALAGDKITIFGPSLIIGVASHEKAALCLSKDIFISSQVVAAVDNLAHACTIPVNRLKCMLLRFTVVGNKYMRTLEPGIL